MKKLFPLEKSRRERYAVRDDVVNTPGLDLPKTGDNGTWWLTICGTLLILCAGGFAILLVMSKRKKHTRQ